jgi:hypothetical protein
MEKRNDGKTTVSFRIPIELERIFHKYCANREDRITKSDLLTQLIRGFLEREGLCEADKPKQTNDIFG